MGAEVREAIEDSDQVEPRGIVEVTGFPLKGTVIQGKEVPQLIDELAILAVAGALADGKTIIRHAEELRVKESDRIAAIAHNLPAMGAQVAEMNDGLEILVRRRCTEFACPVLTIIALRWLLPLPVCLQMAKPLFRMPNVFANLILGLKPCLRSSPIQSGCR